jgi:hypothetical protein
MADPMTWLKLPDDFADDLADLSDTAFRVHVEGLLWAMRRLNGGALTDRDVRRGVEAKGDVPAALRELAVARTWAETLDGWQIVHCMDQQRTPDQVQADRQAAADRQARRRGDTGHAGSHGSSHAVTDANGHGSSHGSSHAPQTRPDQVIKNLSSQPIPPGSARGAVSYPDDFSRFWDAYPRRTEKKAALKAWAKAIREASPEEIISAAAEYAGWVERSGTAYVKYPATWLNKGCWTDEPAAGQEQVTTEHGTWQ